MTDHTSAPFNWGILGAGRIAHKFAKDLQKIPDARIYAVASRSKQRADDFAQQYNATYGFGSYEAMMSCREIDAVYIATRHVHHCETALLCLENHFPVLCEKPLAMNSKEVTRMIEKATEKNTFLMEALWTRFLPATLKVLEILGRGKVGRIREIKADFGFKANYDPEHRLFNPTLGGGSILDIGIYPIFLALLLLGKPERINAQAMIGKTHVDESCGILFKYRNGALAHLHCSIMAKTTTEAFIYGEKGTIHIPGRWHESDMVSVTYYDENREDYRFNYDCKGYKYEALEVMHCVRNKQKQSKLLTLSFSRHLTELLDAVRKKAGIRYPGIDG